MPPWPGNLPQPQASPQPVLRPSPSRSRNAGLAGVHLGVEGVRVGKSLGTLGKEGAEGVEGQAAAVVVEAGEEQDVGAHGLDDLGGGEDLRVGVGEVGEEEAGAVAGEADVPGGDAEGVRGGGSGEEKGEEDGPHEGTVGAGRLRVR